MLDKYIKKLNPVISELKGKRIDKLNGVNMPDYLYSFPNGILLSFELDEKEFNVKLGRLFPFDDYLPKLVLKSVEYNFADNYELKLSEIKYTFSHKQDELDKAFDFLKDNLKRIINNYLQVLENENKKELVLKDKKELKPYLLKDLSNATNLEIELEYRIKEYDEKINNSSSNKVVKEENRKNILSYYSLWILVGLEVTAAILFIIWLFTFLEDDASEIPFATYIILALMIIISLSFLITLTIALFKKKRK